MTTLVPKYDQGGTGAVNRPFNEKLAEILSVKDFGAIGDGTTDDTAAIQAAITAAGTGTIYFPYGTYKVTSTLTVTCNSEMAYGASITPSAMTASAVVYDITARTTHVGIAISGTPATDPTNGTIGIRVKGSGSAASRTKLVSCSSSYCKYGIVVATFSVMITNCNTLGNTTNISLYSPATNQEINDINIIGGNHSGPLGSYAIIVSDQDFPNSGAQYEGARILMQGFAVDGGSIKINRYNNVEIDSIYFENTTTGKCIELGTAGETGYVANVIIRNCWFRTANYAVYCNAGVQELIVDICGYSAILASALYLTSDIYNYTYKSGYSAGSFGNGAEIHTGVRSLTSTSNFFGNGTITQYNLTDGVQIANTTTDFTEWYGPARTNYGSVNLSTFDGVLRYYTTPATAIAGTMNGLDFTCTTLANCYSFNGGDKLTGTGASSTAVYVRQVNYETGVITISQNAGPTTGAATISQVAPYWVSTTFGTAAPTTGTYNQGSIQYNINATVGQPKGWQCTVTGTPGTWVSMGNL